MDILLVRPHPGNDRFGLGPFFRVEPLGLEYIATALRQQGINPTIIDARLERPGYSWLARARPSILALSCMHAVEYDAVIALARFARHRIPGIHIIVGGHAAAAYPCPLEIPEIDAICLGDGEMVFPALVSALARRDPVDTVPGLRLRTDSGWVTTPPAGDRYDLDDVPHPARDLVLGYRQGYHCLLFKPVWLVETARGCPFRCSFCSVWSLYLRSFRERSISSVVEDFEAAGDHVFIVDDLFWNHPDRSLELARALLRRGIRKRWILVQTRADIAFHHPGLLEAWRPLARDFDIFFGLEAPTDSGLDRLAKDATVAESLGAARIARDLRYGVTGNFVVDPDWDEEHFRELWAFVKDNGFERAGYTILTPLPGTDFYRDHPRLRRDEPWSKYDMHHLLWEPRLGASRFFELYAETWRRSILNLGGRKRYRDWAIQVRPAQLLYLTRVLLRTQRMMRPAAYLAEYKIEARQAPSDSTPGL